MLKKASEFMYLWLGLLLLLVLMALFIARIASVPHMPPREGAVTLSNAGKLNINTATVEQLQELPGIGEKLAARIVTYRLTHGGFSGVAEISAVDGITDNIALKLLDYICTEE